MKNACGGAATRVRFLAAGLTFVGCVVAAATGSAVSQQAGVTRIRATFPAGPGASGAVLLDKVFPMQATVGKPFDYNLILTNATNAQIADVTVSDQIPGQLKVDGSAPQPKRAGADRIAWEFPVVEPQETKQILVRVTPTASGAVASCATATFKAAVKVCAQLNVVEPQLMLLKSMPARALVCEDIPVRLQVSNPGTGVASNVRVTDTLPEGLTTADGRNVVAFDAGDLGPGQARESSFTVRATRTGTFENVATARDGGGLNAEAKATITIGQPILDLTKTGPAKVFAGRAAEYDIRVANTGDAVALDLSVQDTLPEGVQFVSASAGGQ